MKAILTVLILSFSLVSFGQVTSLEINKEYPKVAITKAHNLSYTFDLDKGQQYHIAVLQIAIDVKLVFKRGDSVLLEKDSPNGADGYEEFDYTPTATGKYTLNIERFDEAGNAEKGELNIFIKKYSKKELENIAKIKKELESENKKNVLTADIDHFWQAFDELKKAHSRNDSINIIKTIYLDRATDGLIDFIGARQFTPEKFVNAISRFPKFYASIRENTYKVKNTETSIQQVFDNFKSIYPNFRPFKVCFAIGIINTGGTVSDKFVLIGTEVSTSTRNNELTEFGNSAFGKVLAGDTNLVQKIKNIISHECVHTQQRTPLDSNAVVCPLLYACMREGFCDFIGELTAGSQINMIAQEYGNAHEKELWKQFKEEMCSNNFNHWLYNYSSVKDKPADLGYYIGYRLAKAYYNNAVDKKQAVIDIIEMKDPLQFLIKSGYDVLQK